MIDNSQLSNFRYYAANLLKIKTEKTRQIIPFIFNTEQERLHKIWEWQLQTQGMVRLIVLKDRRIGVSTYVDLRSFHQTTTIPNTGAYIITHDKPSLAKIFAMSKLAWENLPSSHRPMRRYNNAAILTFENPVAKERFTNPGLRSLIEVFSANTGTASRASGYNIAHFSEVAFYQNAETLVTSTVPSIEDVPGSVKVYESTGNGRNGFFYDQWRKAKASLTLTRKTSNFYPIFFSWLTFPEYSKLFPLEKVKQEFISTMDEEELYIYKKYKVTLEQLNWRRDRIMEFNGDIDKFHQEYPLDDEEAFISQGSPYFSKKLLLQLLNHCKPPIKRGEVGEFGFSENEDGNLKIWELPIPGEEYVVAADVGEGGEHGDPSTMQVLRVPKNTALIRQVATWKGLVDPTMFAGKITALCKYYNEGLAIPEAKYPGLTTIAELKEIYWNIYRWKYIDRFSGGQSIKMGWETNPATKPIACSYVATCLTAGMLEINDEETINEMLMFVRNRNNSGEAEQGCHDDLVMAYIIGVFCLGREYSIGSLLQKLGQFQDHPTKKEDEPRTIRVTSKTVDRDLFLPDIDVEGRDQSWMNY